MYTAVRIGCLSRKCRGGAAPYAEEEASGPQTSAETVELVHGQSGAVFEVQAGTARHKASCRGRIVYESDMPCLSEEEQNLFQKLSL
ncbi:hypothetical protein D3C79_912470 [compost metagenome]